MPSKGCQGWNIQTLKEFLEARIRSIEDLRERDLKALQTYIDSQRTALELQAKEYERRLDGLNGEQSRIAASQATYVSREIWDRSQAEDSTWKRAEEVLRTGFVTQSEFRTYKETTDRALTLKAGQTQGFGIIGNILTFFAGIVVAALATYAAFHR